MLNVTLGATSLGTKWVESINGTHQLYQNMTRLTNESTTTDDYVVFSDVEIVENVAGYFNTQYPQTPRSILCSLSLKYKSHISCNFSRGIYTIRSLLYERR